MEAVTSLKNCRVLIKDTKRERVIADTKIQEFNAHKNMIRISVSSLNSVDDDQIYILVFGQEGIYEYNGYIRRPIIANEVEVVLSARREKKDRASQRYELEIAGEVEAVSVNHQKVYLRKPIPVTTINFSAVGVLFQSMAQSFDVGDQLELFLNMGESGMYGEYQVVRTQNSNYDSEEYGCRMIQMRKDR